MPPFGRKTPGNFPVGGPSQGRPPGQPMPTPPGGESNSPFPGPRRDTVVKPGGFAQNYDRPPPPADMGDFRKNRGQYVRGLVGKQGFGALQKAQGASGKQLKNLIGQARLGRRAETTSGDTLSDEQKTQIDSVQARLKGVLAKRRSYLEKQAPGGPNAPLATGPKARGAGGSTAIRPVGPQANASLSTAKRPNHGRTVSALMHARNAARKKQTRGAARSYLRT